MPEWTHDKLLLVRGGPPFTGTPALMQTCHQIKAEIRDLFYSRLQFRVYICNYHTYLVEFCRHCSRDFLRLIRNVELIIGFSPGRKRSCDLLLRDFRKMLELFEASTELQKFSIDVKVWTLNHEADILLEIMAGLAEAKKLEATSTSPHAGKDDKLASGWMMLATMEEAIARFAAKL